MLLSSYLHRNTLAFIVRIWREPRDLEDAPLEWRGMIEYVASGERHYFTDMNDLVNFILINLKSEWASPDLEG